RARRGADDTRLVAGASRTGIGAQVPELPEVETIVRDLRGLVLGQTIRGVEVYWERSIATPDPEQFAARLVGQHIRGVDRRGKYIVVRLQRGDLLVHLRMTGQLLVASEGQERECRHLRVALLLDGRRLLFNDTRKLGRLAWVPDAEAALASLGPEPLGDGFTVERLAAAAAKRRVAAKTLLLDQRVLAGVGNIYADEALFAAGVAPWRRACTLERDEVAALYAAIRAEMERAIRNRGTTLSDYRDAAGREGEHREALRVYGRAGRPCPRCGAAIERTLICARSSYHCPRCQR
ncbi:MAG: DNA-formamidopyrimidine glycosylase, partial [Anaerolineae bacterium]|nr:DNA-formamidopyrimidine glycosylase [Anaerolineae bacterium]